MQRPRTSGHGGEHVLAPGTSRVEVTLTRSGEDGQQTRLRLVHTGLAGDLGLLHDDG